MSRLIDADELIKYIKIWEIGTSISSDQKEFIDCIDRQPTAFDADKVVDQLEKEESKARLELMEDRKTAFEFSSKSRLDAYKKALEIVKGGWN
nr:MAG TPA: hypothetical protein [Caudoviricetes sp.]